MDSDDQIADYGFLNETLPVSLTTSRCGQKKATHYSINSIVPMIRYDCYDKHGTEARLSWGSLPSNFKPPVWAPRSVPVTSHAGMSCRFDSMMQMPLLAWRSIQIPSSPPDTFQTLISLQQRDNLKTSFTQSIYRQHGRQNIPRHS